MTQHAPGPDEDGSIADIFTYEIIAARRVQLAAPDLLVALEWMMATRRNCDSPAGLEAEAIARAAIAKARMP